MAIPIILKKPLRVYKIGTVSSFGGFISLFQNFMYHKGETMPTIKINPKFLRCHFPMHIPKSELWSLDTFYIHKGYHSYLTEERAKYSKNEYDDIGIFEIPAGATIYVNYLYGEVVSTDIKYLGSLE